MKIYTCVVKTCGDCPNFTILIDRAKGGACGLEYIKDAVSDVHLVNYGDKPPTWCRLSDASSGSLYSGGIPKNTSVKL